MLIVGVSVGCCYAGLFVFLSSVFLPLFIVISIIVLLVLLFGWFHLIIVIMCCICVMLYCIVAVWCVILVDVIYELLACFKLLFACICSV